MILKLDKVFTGLPKTVLAALQVVAFAANVIVFFQQLVCVAFVLDEL